MQMQQQCSLYTPQPAPENILRSRLLREVSVQTIGDARLQQPSPRIAKVMNSIRADKLGKVIAAWRLTRVDVLVKVDCSSTKALLEQEHELTTVIASRACIKGHHFMFMSHAVKVSRVDLKEQA